jgi:hypothetical protein
VFEQRTGFDESCWCEEQVVGLENRVWFGHI